MPRWMVKAEQTEEKQSGVGRLWNVLWQHNTESSGWWTDDIIRAETAEEAARKMLGYIDVEKHTSHRDRRVLMRVYGPIPEDIYTEFKVGTEIAVTPASREKGQADA